MQRLKIYKTGAGASRRSRLAAMAAAAAAAVVALLCALLPYRAAAQGGASVNAYSPYTMFGIGELGTQGNTVMRSMGGVGVAWRSSQMVSTLNPAGYSATMQRSFIFDFSAEGNFLQNRQLKFDTAGQYDHMARNVKNTVNFHEIAVQFPLAKRLGFGLSLTPYSSVGYNMSSTEQSEDIWGVTGRTQYSYTGDGDVTEVKAGIGWEPFRGFSIGIAAKYYWGNIQHNYVASVANDYVGGGGFASVVSIDDYSISNFKFQAGLQWSIIANDKRLLTVGATYDYGGPLNPKVVRQIVVSGSSSTAVVDEANRSQFRLPHQVMAGIMYQDSRFSVGFDYEFQGWKGQDNGYLERAFGGMEIRYEDTNTFKVGLEYTPNRFDVRRYLRRVAYRIGGRYGDYYQSYNGRQLRQYAVTAGVGFPLRFLGATSIDLAVEYGGRGTTSSVVVNTDSVLNPQRRVGLVRQDYFKVSLGLSLFGEDYWFVRPKYD